MLRLLHPTFGAILLVFPFFVLAFVDDTPEGDEAAPAPEGATPRPFQ